jgi:hypothetical protein
MNDIKFLPGHMNILSPNSDNLTVNEKEWSLKKHEEKTLAIWSLCEASLAQRDHILFYQPAAAIEAENKCLKILKLVSGALPHLRTVIYRSSID